MPVFKVLNSATSRYGISVAAVMLLFLPFFLFPVKVGRAEQQEPEESVPVSLVTLFAVSEPTPEPTS